ncbi:MAG TPA: DNA gyrase subunit A [Acidimicrobiia bacterium]|nr:DNA gyrase subunit A [Acidimicrobiia bacterium]
MPDGQQSLGAIEPIEIQEEMGRSFMDYAMSVIVSRALPDVRDGLKPVHRRILYGMYEAGLRPERPYTKCAQVVGRVMGQYHPHGDTAIYDALARMAQSFSLRHPLVDGHGNFGSPDPNDRPAAMRYCVTGNTRLRTLQGSVRIDQLVDAAQPNSTVECDLKVVGRRGEPVRADAFFHSGTHPVLRAKTTEGFEITGTANHPVLCLVDVLGVPVFQWKLLEELRSGDKVAIDRRPVEDDHHDEAAEKYSYRRTMAGLKSADKQIPEFVWRAPTGAKRAFLQALFEGDGCVSVLDDKRRGDETIQISYSTRSEGLSQDIQLLLLEFGIVARRCHDDATGEWKVYLTSRRQVRRFAYRVGFACTKQDRLLEMLDTTPEKSCSAGGDVIPFLADYLRAEAGRGHRRWLAKHAIGRADLWEDDPEAILSKIGNPESEAVARSIAGHGYYYATVASVEGAGEAPVYSIRVDSDDHAFSAGGFINHNTECRLAPLAMQLLAGIDEDTVDFVETYDGKTQEPAVLPARFPNLLVNGSGGIAVGMATNIPPHNLREVIDATIHKIDNPEATADELMQFVLGPDFPTGALIMGRAGILDAYRTGRGSVRMRAVAEIDEDSRGGARIVVTEVPYQTSVESIGSKIEELVRERRIEGIRDARNESSRAGTRLVIDLKRDANAQVVLNQLYKHTPMQTSFGVIMLALVDGVPKVLNLAEVLTAYIAHQVEVIRRRTEFRLRKARDRAHIVEGLLRALDMLDEVIALIRGSADVEVARAGLMAPPFDFSEIQANHILDMPLRRLTGLERQKLIDEFAELTATIAELESILGDEVKLRNVIKAELTEVRTKFGDERRSKITFDPGDLDTLDLIDDDEVVVTMSKGGYIKTVAADAFRRQGRGGRGVTGAKLKEEDYVEHLLTTTAHSYLLFFSTRGRVYRLRAHEIPMKERTARGTALVNLIALQPGEKVQAIIDTRQYEEGRYLFFCTKKGVVKKTLMSEYDSSLRTGLIAINLREDDELVRVVQTNGTNDIFMVSRDGMTIRFSENDVRPMGRATSGVRGMKLKDVNDAVVGCDVARDDVEILLVTKSGHGKRTRLDRFNRQGRGGQGVRGMKVTAQRGVVVAAFMVGSDDEILVFSSAGNIIRMEAGEVSSQGRDATGVRIARVGAGESVVAVAPVLDTGVVEE